MSLSRLFSSPKSYKIVLAILSKLISKLTTTKEREEIVKRTKTDSKSLFLQNTGKPVKLSTLRSWTKSWNLFLGEDLYFHALRHYFVTALTKKGLSDELIISIVGWSSADMKKIYTDIDDKDRNWDKDLNKLESFIKEFKED